MFGVCPSVHGICNGYSPKVTAVAKCECADGNTVPPKVFFALPPMDHVARLCLQPHNPFVDLLSKLLAASYYRLRPSAVNAGASSTILSDLLSKLPPPSPD
ncbi:hypothetical protein XPA_003211 [Xanthoria parietina]